MMPCLRAVLNFVVLAFLFASIASCSHFMYPPTPSEQKTTTSPADKTPTPPAQKTTASPADKISTLPAQKTATSSADKTKRHIVISAQNPQKGIESFRIQCARNPQDQALIKEYIKGLEDLRSSADSASAKGDFTSAGRLYKVLFVNYQEFRPFTTMLSFDRDYLHAKLSYCKTILSGKGFEEYRKGRLSEAISYWQDYLSIDPSDEGIRKAVNTASDQRKNLKQTN